MYKKITEELQSGIYHDGLPLQSPEKDTEVPGNIRKSMKGQQLQTSAP